MFNPNTQIGEPIIVRSKILLTTSYASATIVVADVHNAVGITFDYAKGSETAGIVKVETSNDGGATYAQTTNESRSSGITTVTLEEREFTSTGIYNFLIEPMRAKLIRISYKNSGGSSNGSATITAVPLWV